MYTAQQSFRAYDRTILFMLIVGAILEGIAFFATDEKLLGLAGLGAIFLIAFAWYLIRGRGTYFKIDKDSIVIPSPDTPIPKASVVKVLPWVAGEAGGPPNSVILILEPSFAAKLANEMKNNFAHKFKSWRLMGFPNEKTKLCIGFGSWRELALHEPVLREFFGEKFESE